MVISGKIAAGVKGVLGALFVLFILFIGVKGCVVTIWVSPKSIETYAIEGEDGRSITMVFLPKNETIISYADPTRESLEVVRTKMHGEYGTHYVGPIWELDGPGYQYWFGFRWYSKGEPVVMDIKVLKKYRIGPGDSDFPREGESSASTLLFGDGELRFNGMWLRRIDNDVEVLRILEAAVPGEDL